MEGKKRLLNQDNTGTFLPSDSWFSHKTWTPASPPGSVLARPCTSTLLSLCQAEIHTERMTIWVCLGDQRKFTGTATQEAFQEWFQNWTKCFVVESSAKGKKPNSNKVNEKTIYINCSESLQKDLAHRNQTIFWTNHHSIWQSDQLATFITATTMMLSWNYSTWNTSAISCCVGTGPPDSAGVATGLVVSVSLLTEKQHHLEQLPDTIAESKKSKQYCGI